MDVGQTLQLWITHYVFWIYNLSVEYVIFMTRMTHFDLFQLKCILLWCCGIDQASGSRFRRGVTADRFW